MIKLNRKKKEIEFNREKNYFRLIKNRVQEIGTVLSFLLKNLRDKFLSSNNLKDKKILGRNIVIAISITSASIFALLIISSINGSFRFGKTTDFLILIILSLIGPYSFYEYARLKRIDRLEKHLPDFLRDLAENGKSGMPLHTAIRTASHGKYGNLTPEIKRMAIQISWGASSNKALKDFSKRVNTPLVNRCVNLIIEASNSGGNIADVLIASAEDTRKVQLMHEQRKIEMSTYTSVVYIAFFVFLAVVLVLTKSLIPAMAEAQGGQEINRNEVVAGNIGVGGNLDVEKIKFIYLSAAVVQAMGDGIAAGVISDGRLVTGMRHSFIMVLLGFLLLRII